MLPTVLFMATRTRNPGTDWLASCAPDPVRAHRHWADGKLAPIPAGLCWLAAEAGLMRSVSAMQRIGPGRLGPVLVYPEADLAWWLVPHAAGDELADIGCITVHPAGWALACPPAHQYMNGRGWLEKPDGSGLLSDPVAMGAAFGPGGPLRLSVGAFV